EVTKRIQELAGKNEAADDGRLFLGAGVGVHHIPSVVPALAGRSEFVTSYTSYQPEISQGMLQTLFEYQSLMAELLAIDVVNSSMYDLASGLAEAILMCVRVKKRTRFLVPRTMNPSHREVISTYTEPLGIEIEKVDYDRRTGLLSISDLESHLNDQIAGVYIENPSYLGFIESQVDRISEMVHGNGALLVAGVDILSLGIMRPPGQYGADIVVAEGQPLGTPVSFGGPLLGVFGCTGDMKLIRQLPGRLVGMTRTSEEPYERGFVLTLSPREQHIRREKATSNICSNQALVAVTAAVYASVMGAAGLRELGENVACNSHYMADRLDAIPTVKTPALEAPFWKEFVVKFENDTTARHVHEELLQRDFHGGKLLSEDFPELGEAMLLCVTELHSKDVMDEFVSAVEGIVTNGGDGR
ncbi:MAG: aminomethyl-transferring glycine dehydrogenase subunit GcvPA, partial [Promethearchaeota archaeon]